jgi:hypothetical protein
VLPGRRRLINIAHLAVQTRRPLAEALSAAAKYRDYRKRAAVLMPSAAQPPNSNSINLKMPALCPASSHAYRPPAFLISKVVNFDQPHCLTIS